MTITEKDKERVQCKQNRIALEYKIDIATQTLDRNVGFVTNCDNKASIVLTAVGVLLTILLTNEGMNEIVHIVKSCIHAKNFGNIFFLLCFKGAFLVMLLGMFNLVSVLVGRTSEESIGREYPNSRIFFAGIKNSGDYETYNQKFNNMNKKELLNDLIEQIYINSNIASIKYKKFNCGLKCTLIGLILFIAFLTIGNYIY